MRDKIFILGSLIMESSWQNKFSFLFSLIDVLLIIFIIKSQKNKKIFYFEIIMESLIFVLFSLFPKKKYKISVPYYLGHWYLSIFFKRLMISISYMDPFPYFFFQICCCFTIWWITKIFDFRLKKSHNHALIKKKKCLLWLNKVKVKT